MQPGNDGLEEIEKQFETLFAPYANKNATYTIEETLADTSDHLVATVLWKNAFLASEQRICVHRISFVLVPEGEGWLHPDVTQLFLEVVAKKAAHCCSTFVPPHLGHFTLPFLCSSRVRTAENFFLQVEHRYS